MNHVRKEEVLVLMKLGGKNWTLPEPLVLLKDEIGDELWHGLLAGLQL